MLSPKWVFNYSLGIFISMRIERCIFFVNFTMHTRQKFYLLMSLFLNIDNFKPRAGFMESVGVATHPPPI